MDRVEDALFDIAKGLAPSLLAAAARRVRDEALGDAQERALEKVFEEATAVTLVEVARHDREDRGLPDRLAAEFGRFYRDPWVAETLVGVAISAEDPPFEKLRHRYGEVGNDPDGLPVDFGDAMRLLIYELTDRLRREASRAGSPLFNLVQLSELGVIRKKVEGLARELEDGDSERDTPPGASASDTRDGRFAGYERGPEGADFDVLFAGFFLPSGPEGRFTRGGASRAFEREFLELFQRELAGHRLNTSGIELGEAVLPARVLDHRLPADYAGCHDYESFSEVTGRLAERTLGVVWGTVRDDGGLGTLEILVNPDRFYGGPQALVALSGVKRLADREDLPSRPTAAFAARVLAAMWAQSFCAELDRRGMHDASYVVASDSRRLVERALEDLGRELGTVGHQVVEEQQRGLLPQIIRQEASSLWREGKTKEALVRLLDALKIWPYGPLSGRGEFREYEEAHHAFSIAGRVEAFDQFLATNHKHAPAVRRNIARQYAERALVGFPPVDLELFVVWVQEAFARGVDVEEDVEVWFSELTAAHPREPFVVAFWGEARRLVAVHKYGAGFGSPSSWRMDRAVEKFEEAYAMDQRVPYFAARAQGIRFTAALAFGDTDEGRRRFDEAAGWWEKAKPYYREHAPWALET
ncbi:MAG: hypothetical protein AB1425_10125 [Actinomycetota bacterium]